MFMRNGCSTTGQLRLVLCVGAVIVAVAAPACGKPVGGVADREAVSSWLDKAEVSSHNGMNPELEISPDLLVAAVEVWKKAVTVGPERRRLDAASALAKHPNPSQLRGFWRAQLNSNLKPIRFWAVVMLANEHDPDDFLVVLELARTDQDNAHVFAVRLRDWKDRRAVPVLAEFLDNAERLVSENAAVSLEQLPGVPRLQAVAISHEPSVHLPNGAWTAPETSMVPPYRKWWREEGRQLFWEECEFWEHIGTRKGPTMQIAVPAESR